MSETFTEWAERTGAGITPKQAMMGQMALDVWRRGGAVQIIDLHMGGRATLRRALRDYMNGVGDDVTPLDTVR